MVLEREHLEAMLAEGCSLEEIGRRVGRHPSTVSFWLRKYDLQAAHVERYSSRGGLSKESLEALIAEGLSIRDMAAQLDRSYSTVRHWLTRHGLKTRVPTAKQATLATVCPTHGATPHGTRTDGYARCLKCRSQAVTRFRQRTKAQLVEEFGGRCRACGYDECVRALHFHHRDRTEKRFSVSNLGRVASIATLRQEAEKCVLLCANCHMAVEAGIRELPD